MAAVLFVVLVGFARPIAVLMQAPAEAVVQTTGYVRICGAGIFFIVAYNVLSAIFRGLGDSKSPLLFVLVACIVNIVGDLVLVAGFHLDAAGAALAACLRSYGAVLRYHKGEPAICVKACGKRLFKGGYLRRLKLE